MKIKAEKDSGAHPSVQNDFLLYPSKFIVQSHFTTRELPITTPIHIYYCFMTSLKLCAVLYLIMVCRRGLSHFCSITWRKNRIVRGRGGTVGCRIILPTCTQFAAHYHPRSYFSTSILCKHLSPAECLHLALFQQIYQIPFARLNPILWFPVHISNLSSLLFISSHSVLASVGNTSQF